MPSLRELMIVELDRVRVGFGEVGPSAVTVRSPVCGDEVTVEVRLSDGGDDGPVIRSLHWRGHGCTVSMASASALAGVAPGMTVAAFRAANESFGALVRGGEPSDELEAEFEAHPALGDAVAFTGIGRLPLRGGCATLAWGAVLTATTAPGTALSSPGSGA